MFRDDRDALLARLAALDARVEGHEAELAARDAAIAMRDARIEKLESELRKLRDDLVDSEASLVDAQRRRVVESAPIGNKSVAVGSPEAREEAARLLAEGVSRHRAGDKRGALTCFELGLSLVPGDAQLLRAMRRYT